MVLDPTSQVIMNLDPDLDPISHIISDLDQVTDLLMIQQKILLVLNFCKFLKNFGTEELNIKL